MVSVSLFRVLLSALFSIQFFYRFTCAVRFKLKWTDDWSRWVRSIKLIWTWITWCNYNLLDFYCAHFDISENSTYVSASRIQLVSLDMFVAADLLRRYNFLLYNVQHKLNLWFRYPPLAFSLIPLHLARNVVSHFCGCCCIRCIEMNRHERHNEIDFVYRWPFCVEAHDIW